MRRHDPRVDEAVKQAVAKLLKEDVEDPRVRHVTVTDVRVTEDYREATVYYTALDPGLVSAAAGEDATRNLPDSDEVAEGLRSARPRVQGMLDRHVRLRNTPRLTFEPDDVIEEARRVDELLADVRGGTRGTSGAGESVSSDAASSASDVVAAPDSPYKDSPYRDKPHGSGRRTDSRDERPGSTEPPEGRP